MNFNDIKKVNENLKTVNIKGKEYVEVNKRVLAFRELIPDGSITTDIVSQQVINTDKGEKMRVVMKATVCDGDGKILATGMAYETEGNGYINATSFIENCETSAIGRALGFIGIGIDTSIASLEEVENAKLQQEEMKPVTDKDIEKLIEVWKLDGRDVEKTTNYLLEYYGYKDLSEMNQKEYSKALLGKTEKRIKYE